MRPQRRRGSNTIQISQRGERVDRESFFWQTQNKQRAKERTSVMPLKLHDLPDECKLPSVMQTQLLQDIYPENLVEAALKERRLPQGEPKKLRQRKLSVLLILWLVIAMNCYPRQSQLSVLTNLSRGATL